MAGKVYMQPRPALPHRAAETSPRGRFASAKRRFHSPVRERRAEGGTRGMTVEKHVEMLFDGPEDGPTIVLAHGAGAPMDSAFMNIVARGLAAAGLCVARFEFPYMMRRRQTGERRAPDREPALREAWLAAIAALGGGDRVVVGGKSMGGRIASMVADEAGVRGLVCLGYPFHPP